MTRAKGGPFVLRPDLELVDKIPLYPVGLFYVYLCA